MSLTSTPATAAGPEPDLRYSDVEEQLRSSVRALLADRCPPEAVLARCETGEPYDQGLWRALAAELGCAGLLVPEAFGGQGGSAREVAVVLEELGRAVAPVPFLGSAVLATSALLACAPGEPVAVKLDRMADGVRIGALAVPLSTPPGAPFPDTVLAEPVDGASLTGRISTVADAAVADELIVPAVGADGPGLYAVSTRHGATTVTPLTPLDLTRGIADVVLDRAPATLLAGPDLAPAALHRTLLAGAGLLASEQVGVAQWCLDTTVRYLRERHQFGRPVGSFQAVKHRLSEVWLRVTSARAAARYAADCLAADAAGSAGGADLPVAVATAQSYCADAAVLAAEECVQLLGGIGMTWEHPAHLYLKRAKADQLALGTPGRHRATLAELVDLPTG